MKRRFSCALITGGSSGLGAEFATQLSERVDTLVLVARRTAKLETIADRLRKESPKTAIVTITADLSKEGERHSLATDLIGKNLVPDLLINNAGLGDYGEFTGAQWDDIDRMLKVNIEALTHLSHLFAGRMAQKGDGVILNVSSLASTMPIADFAVYAATKAYVSSFTEALRIELREEGVDVLALCPGPVKTEFGDVARREGRKSGMPPTGGFFYVSKEQVVSEAIEGMDRRKARVFPGLQIAAAGLIFGALPLAALRLMMKHRPRR
ncbi:MAG: SDR family NAD(P)-dependent oxidoreductase [Akkermansiaceae bacterium]